MTLSRTLPLAGLAAAALLGACGADSTGPPPQELVIETENLPDAILGVPYAEGIQATGGRLDYSWDVIGGALPPGLELSFEDLPDGDDLLITGIPSQEGTFVFTLEVTSEDGQTDTGFFRVEVGPLEELVIDNAVLPPALAGGPYEVPLRASGGRSADYQWAITEGSLPAGLSFVGDRIEGTPTTPGTSTVTVRVESDGETTSRTFEILVLANRPGAFDITAVPVAPIPAELVSHVEAALDQWEAVITQDLTATGLPATFFSGSSCGGFGQDLNGTTIEDIMILINISEIDGAGGILGQAGPCATRDASGLPVAGVLILDADDLMAMAATTTATHVIAHEVGHVLGFGSLWDNVLLTGKGGNDPRFTGSAATAVWHDLGGTGDVPVEGGGGQGTAGSHWDEETFDGELMTGFSEQPGIFQPLSALTIAAMEDLGYVVDYDAADAYTLPVALIAPEGRRPNLGRDILLGEIPRVVPTGAGPSPGSTPSGDEP